MRSKGSRVILGVWGLRVCSLDVAQPFATVRNRPQPSATIRNRSQQSATVRARSVYGRAFSEFCNSGHFWDFTGRVASFRVAGVALHDIQTCCITCRKSFCVTGAILLRRFQKMSSRFRGRRGTLDVSILRGRRNTLEESCWVFFANRIVRAASSGDSVQIPSWQAWHFVRCAEK